MPSCVLITDVACCIASSDKKAKLWDVKTSSSQDYDAVLEYRGHVKGLTCVVSHLSQYIISILLNSFVFSRIVWIFIESLFVPSNLLYTRIYIISRFYSLGRLFWIRHCPVSILKHVHFVFVFLFFALSPIQLSIIILLSHVCWIEVDEIQLLGPTRLYERDVRLDLQLSTNLQRLPTTGLGFPYTFQRI